MRPDHPHLLQARTSAGRLSSASRPERVAFRAAVVPLPDDRAARKLRRCLHCREQFLSDGAGDRICDDCHAAMKRAVEGL